MESLLDIHSILGCFLALITGRGKLPLQLRLPLLEDLDIPSLEEDLDLQGIHFSLRFILFYFIPIGSPRGFEPLSIRINY